MNNLSILVNNLILITFKTYGMKFFSSDSYLTTVGYVSAFFSGLRFVYSLLMNKYSLKTVYGSIIVINIILAFSLPYVCVKSEALYMANIAL